MDQEFDAGEGEDRGCRYRVTHEGEMCSGQVWPYNNENISCWSILKRSTWRYISSRIKVWLALILAVCHLPNFAMTDGTLAETAEQMGKKVEHTKSRSTQAKSAI